jgi:hypothetical protein
MDCDPTVVHDEPFVDRNAVMVEPRRCSFSQTGAVPAPPLVLDVDAPDDVRR